MHVTRSLRGVVRRLKAPHWLYLVLHAFVFVSGLLLVMTGHVVAVGIGGSLVAAGVAGWVLFLYVWFSEDSVNRLRVFREFGLVGAFEVRSVRIKDEYDVRLQGVREAIDIMGFGLRSLRVDYRGQFEHWAACARVRILLIDPEFPAAEGSLANQRDVEEKDRAGTIAEDVRAFVREFSGLLQKENSRFEIRLYRCLPSVNIFRIDDHLFWGPYLIGDVSRNLPTFLVERDGLLYGRLTAHFDAIWASNQFSRPVPGEWLTPNDKASAS